MLGVRRRSFGRKRRKSRAVTEKQQGSRNSSQQLASLKHHAPYSNRLMPAPNRPLPGQDGQSRRIKELQWLIQRASVAAQLIKHRRSPRLCEGPRGPMVSHFGTLTGFHSAPSQPIVSRRREHALDVLGREHGAGNVSHQILRFGPFSKVLPSPPTAFRHLRGAEASGPWPASPLYATLSERNKLLINAK